MPESARFTRESETNDVKVHHCGCASTLDLALNLTGGTYVTASMSGARLVCQQHSGAMNNAASGRQH
ncbi:hypothetical protein BH23CHL5_BH23CHL5_27280 [soil metagenome]